MPSVEHRAHKGLDNRAENSHQPTRQCERAMKGLPWRRRSPAVPVRVQWHLTPLLKLLPKDDRSELSESTLLRSRADRCSVTAYRPGGAAAYAAVAMPTVLGAFGSMEMPKVVDSSTMATRAQPFTHVVRVCARLSGRFDGRDGWDGRKYGVPRRRGRQPRDRAEPQTFSGSRHRGRCLRRRYGADRLRHGVRRRPGRTGRPVRGFPSGRLRLAHPFKGPARGRSRLHRQGERSAGGGLRAVRVHHCAGVPCFGVPGRLVRRCTGQAGPALRNDGRPGPSRVVPDLRHAYGASRLGTDSRGGHRWLAGGRLPAPPRRGQRASAVRPPDRPLGDRQGEDPA